MRRENTVTGMVGSRHLRQEKRRGFKKCRGVTAVEMAFIIPIIFLFLLAAADFARANMIRNTLENAAFAGARRGMLPGADQFEIAAESQKILDILAIKDATITVTPTTITELTTQVTVSITAPMSSNLYAGISMLRGKSITRACSLTREQFAVQLLE